MTPENRIYDNLLALPLFLGMSRNDLQTAAGLARFDFRKEPAETLLAQAGTPCTHLFFLIEGEVSVRTAADDDSYAIEETVSAPDIFQPERIFGLYQRFSRTYTTKSDCSLLCIPRQDILLLADKLDIFRINLLNYISTLTQRCLLRSLRSPSGQTEGRIAQWVEQRCASAAGTKQVHIKMRRLAEELNESRMDISVALHRLQDRHLVSIHRGRFDIPLLEKLVYNGSKNELVVRCLLN